MKKPQKLFACGLLLLCAVTLLDAQKLSGRDSLESARPRSSRIALTNQQVDNALRIHGITDDKLLKIRKLGIDLRAHLVNGDPPNEMIDAAMKDVVIIGKAVAITNMPRPSNEPFHSKVTIEISEVLRGAVQGVHNIDIMRLSGPVSDNHNKITLRSTDAEFKIGETSVFFLTKIENDPYLTTRFKSFFSTRDTASLVPVYWVRGGNKYTVIDSTIMYEGQSKSIESFRANVKRIASILDSQ